MVTASSPSAHAKPLYGLIPAAGKGVRARPYTHEIHKGMLEINGVPNIERIINIMRDDLAIKHIVIIVGYLKDNIKDYFGAGDDFGVSITYIENEQLHRGWAWSVFLAKTYIDDYFCIMLCDEYYLNSNHRELRHAPYQNHLVTCAAITVDDANLIKQNYGITTDGHTISQLVEKPASIQNTWMGSGTFICHPDIFNLLATQFEQRESVDFIQLLNQNSSQKSIGLFELHGTYINMNNRNSLQLANYHDRIVHFEKYTTSLLINSEGNEEDILFTIKRYQELQFFQQIAVVLPAKNCIHDILVPTGVEIILCPESTIGFGERMHHGLSQLNTDIFIITEANYSFPQRDVEKLLSYLKESDMVVGTRTTRQLIEQGSTMQGIVRIAHAALGALLELLWWTKEGRFTDVGCSFRAIWKTSYQKISPDLRSTGPEFLADMVITSLNKHLRVIEIPVNYFNRSESQNYHYRNAGTFFRLLLFLLKKRLFN